MRPIAKRWQARIGFVLGVGPTVFTSVAGDYSPAATPYHYRSCFVDRDGDGIADCYETNTGVYVGTSNTGTSPTNADTDGDGLSDGDEVYGTQNGLNLPA